MGIEGAAHRDKIPILGETDEQRYQTAAILLPRCFACPQFSEPESGAEIQQKLMKPHDRRRDLLSVRQQMQDAGERLKQAADRQALSSAAARRRT
jgi:hypothetical protein